MMRAIHKQKMDKDGTPINQLACNMSGNFKNVYYTNHWSLVTCKKCLSVETRRIGLRMREILNLQPKNEIPRMIHKNGVGKYRTLCDVKIDNETIMSSYYWDIVDCPDCLKNRGGIEKKMVGKGNTMSGMVR